MFNQHPDDDSMPNIIDEERRKANTFKQKARHGSFNNPQAQMEQQRQITTPKARVERERNFTTPKARVTPSVSGSSHSLYTNSNM